MVVMKRAMVLAAATAALMLGAVSGANAQMELKITAPAAPGGGWDSTARSMQTALTSAGLAKSVQVLNVPGAGGTIGLASFVNNAKGDGSQLLVNGFVMVGAILTNNSPVSLQQVTPIARLTAESLVVVVPAKSSIQDMKGLLAALKADPAKVTFAGGSAGGVDQILAALIGERAGVDGSKINYVPFAGGGEALAAILGGRVTAGISGWGEFEGQVKAGSLRAIAVSSAQRLPGNATPTLKEQGVDLELLNWRSVVAPPGITPEQKKDLSTAIEKMAKSSQWQEILKQKGWDDAYMASPEFDAFLKSEQTRVDGVLRKLGLVK